MSGDELKSLDAWSPGPLADALTIYAWRPAARRLRAKATDAGIGSIVFLAAAGIAGASAFLLLWWGFLGLGLIAAMLFLVTTLADEERPLTAWCAALVPVLWWWAWSHGLAARGQALAAVYGVMVVWAAVGASLADVAIGLLFRRRFGGLSIVDWQPFDRYFALVAGGPGINLALLTIGYVAGRPGAGLVVVGWWSIVTALVRALRLAQAGEQKARGKAIAPGRSE